MWVLSKEFTFEAAHYLPFHDGKCQRLHGHSWKGFVYVSRSRLIDSGSKSGMVLDFSDIKKVVSPLLDQYLDHYVLNETTGIESPTSEAIAKWIYDRIKPQLPDIVAVRIDETCTSSCLYSPEITGSGALGIISNAIAMG